MPIAPRHRKLPSLSSPTDIRAHRLSVVGSEPMCERLVIPGRAEAESELSVMHPWWQFSVRFNVAVSHSVPVVRMHERETEGVMMRWGLVPPSAKGDLMRGSHGCARSDALQSAEEFRSAWLHGQRGIVPVAGFYLWQRTAAGYRQPFYVRLVNRPVFGVAVLWERSVNDDDDVVESCALVTVPANPLLGEIDNSKDQMPAILRRDGYDAWLGSSVSLAKELLESHPQTRMVTHPVGPFVNDLELDEPRLIQRARQGPAD
jgi:putative SOS response-associated peptidase YedK